MTCRYTIWYNADVANANLKPKESAVQVNTELLAKALKKALLPRTMELAYDDLMQAASVIPSLGLNSREQAAIEALFWAIDDLGRDQEESK